MKKQQQLTFEEYTRLYQASINDPESFWSDMAQQQVSWFRTWDSVQQGAFYEGNETWFDGATLNVSYNCIDRHIAAGNGDKVAYHWEGNEGERIDITYHQLLEEVCKLANALKERGVTKGDTVCIYMPMIPEAVYAMLACTRIGAVHSVVFGGFSAEALKARILDANCVAVITATHGRRGEKTTKLFEKVERILPDTPGVSSVIVVSHDTYNDNRVVQYDAIVSKQKATCEPVAMASEDPLFILYTSGSTGKPKGVVHTTAGYLLYAAVTHRYVFDIQETDVYWCAADVGWITGHTYMVYGPLCNGVTSVLFEGIPTYPSPARYWEVVDTYGVSIFYSTPTAIRALMGFGDTWVQNTKRTSLRILGSVGEPINPEAWKWYHDVVGARNCHIVDTWWQTETGGIAIVPLPGVVQPKPGSAMLPFFGVKPRVVDESGVDVSNEGSGILLLQGAWPGRMRTLFNDQNRFLETYMQPYPGNYFSGDAAQKDANGYLRITGRVDDTLNVSGRLLGTAELESALATHPWVVEAAVVAREDTKKGWSPYAVVVLKEGSEGDDTLREELQEIVAKEIGSFAKPTWIQFADGLPKTRSGKIMRRIIRAIVAEEQGTIGDVSTLTDPSVIDSLQAGRIALKR